VTIVTRGALAVPTTMARIFFVMSLSDHDEKIVARALDAARSMTWELGDNDFEVSFMIEGTCWIGKLPGLGKQAEPVILDVAVDVSDFEKVWPEIKVGTHEACVIADVFADGRHKHYASDAFKPEWLMGFRKETAQ
jgi:hypothetical protein